MLAGERFVAEFDLGNTPVAGLAEIMERELGILVLMVDAPMVCAPSSARCAASRRIFPPIARASFHTPFTQPARETADMNLTSYDYKYIF